jgi:hypothetical protein
MMGSSPRHFAFAGQEPQHEKGGAARAALSEINS